MATLSMSGMIAASTAIDIISNNIANSQTIGFKTSKARFADVFAAAPSKGVASSVGAGVGTAIISQQFTQGGIEATGRPFDLAITGNGLFRLEKDKNIFYTRDGQFQLGYQDTPVSKVFLANRDGYAVTGYGVSYAADPVGIIDSTAAPAQIDLSTSMPAKATATVTLGANLDVRVAAPVAPVFDANNPLSYNSTAGSKAFDAQGTLHNIRMYFVHVPAGNNWQMYSAVDDGPVNGPDSLSFDTVGRLSSAGTFSQTYTFGVGGSLGPVTLDLSGSTQYGNDFSVDSIVQDGYAVGALLESTGGFQIAGDGVVWGSYDNGQSRRLGQIVLADFVNREALVNVGDGRWIANADQVRGTGKELLYAPGSLGGGTVQSGAKEKANVDLAIELVALIEQQRNYQASAQTFKIMDEALSNLARIR